MNHIRENAEEIFLIEGIDHTGKIKQFGIPKRQILDHYERGSNIKLAQLIALVDPGLIEVEHIFEGLKRPLCVGDDMNADKFKLAFCWKPIHDCWWTQGNRFDGIIEIRAAPEHKVFVVNVSPNRVKVNYPTPDYWIDRWYWVKESDTLSGAPVNCNERYVKQLK
jgi:hypothetical protein